MSYFFLILSRKFENSHQMGLALPLPERIPAPKGDQEKQLNEMGIAIISDRGDDGCVFYALPSGWQMVDASWRADLPYFYILDNDRMKRVSISGSWKGAYDNNLRMEIKTEPPFEKYVAPPSNIIEESQTSVGNIAGTFAEALDIQHRPSEKATQTKRAEPYIT